MSVRPIFIFSISRSGSTLVQRVIGAHDGVATVSEPWLLLPQAYAFRRRGIDGEYLHFRMVEAIDDFCRELPRGQADYRDALRDFVLDLYAKAGGDGARYFLDKSPPYCLIANEIIELFPEGRFVFLWRNPLSVVASLIDTWGPWRPTMFREDLFVGLPRLVAAYEAHRDRVHAVRYEQLIGGDPQPWRALLSYVGIDFDPAALTSFADVSLNGRMGDPTGVHRYSQLSTEPERKWRATLANPLRKAWCVRYLRLLGAERLATMGYDHSSIVAALRALPTTLDSLPSDVARMAKDIAKEPVRVRTRHHRVGTPNVVRALLSA